MTLNESIVEDAALEWLLLRQGFRRRSLNFGGQDGGQGWAMRSGTEPQLAPGEHADGTLTPALSQGERESYSEVVMVGRLREAIRRLNPANDCGNPHPASPKGRGGEARADVRQFRMVRNERRPKP